MGPHSRFVGYGSSEYEQAVELRYRLFYEEHGIEMESVLTPREKTARHFVVLSPDEKTVWAYGQLYEKNSNEYQIFQMVVAPQYQKKGLGSIVMQELVKAATRQPECLLTLSARSDCVGFYEKFGFEIDGEVFPSSSTGVPHVKMIKQGGCIPS